MRIRRARKAVLVRLKPSAVALLRSSKRSFAYAHRISLDRLPIHKRVPRRRRNRAHVMRIRIVIIIVNGIIQNVDVRNPRIRDVNVANIDVAGVIPRMERLAPSQRGTATSPPPAAPATQDKAKYT